MIARPAGALVAAAAAAIVLVLVAPFPVVVLSVALLGPVHVLLAARYLTGRVAGAITPGAVRMLVVAVAAMLLVRAGSLLHPHAGHVVEAVGGVVLISLAMLWGLSGRWRILAAVPLLLLGAAALAQNSWYWFALTHAHNLVLIVFLWDWTRGLPCRRRAAFTATGAVLLLGFPLAVLAGLVDPLLSMASAEWIGGLVDPAAVLSAASHHAIDAAFSLRLLVVFAFMQLMHYALWIGFFPMLGRAEMRRSPLAPGRRFWILAAGATALVWASYAVGYGEGRALYSVLGAVNVALEQPIATWLLLTAMPASATSALVIRLRNAPR